jgi:two-component system cell cycle response regulator DivK
MAGETVLVVEDEPVSLRLAAAVLRSEGYRVHLASTGEEALRTLATIRPDLMLVDVQLPGMDGLELTRHVRLQARTKDMLVVALTASTSRDAETRAYEAGCDGFIAKPIDSRSLGRRLEAFFHGQQQTPPPPPQGEASPGGLKLEGPEVEGLRRAFLAEAGRHVRRMLEFGGAQIDTVATARLFHRWIGSAGVLGYMDIAEQARAAETVLSEADWTVSALREALTALSYALAAPKEAAPTPMPDTILRELNRNRVALVGFADDVADEVCAALGQAGALPLLFPKDEPADSEAIRACRAVMVHVRLETLLSPWLRPDASLPAGLPLVLVGAREHLLALDTKAQSRACEYLIDGWQPEEVVMRLSFAISRAGRLRESDAAKQPDASLASSSRAAFSGKLHVLIADDDAHVLTLVRSTLQEIGMECRSAATGPEALQIVHEWSPHAAVLDVNMPGIDGFELLSTIRREGLPVRVVMLTARQKECDVLRGFSLGADDYVVKPFNPLELAARLKRLL